MKKENNTLIHWELSFWKPPPKAPAKSMNLSLLLLKKSNKEFPSLTIPIITLISPKDNKEEESKLVIQSMKRKSHLDVVEVIESRKKKVCSGAQINK